MVRLGPIQLEFWHLIIIAIMMVFLGWIIRGYTIRVAGTWKRVDEGMKPGQRESIALVQFGPFVRGRRMMDGGFQEYTGVLWGRTIAMTRRDHGMEMLLKQRFPKEVAEEIDGTVTARMQLTLSADGQAIFGSFTPQKIEFTYKPPEITKRFFLEASYRRYKLISREITDQGETPAPAPKPKAPVRKTL